jgi:hypothetical protein
MRKSGSFGPALRTFQRRSEDPDDPDFRVSGSRFLLAKAAPQALGADGHFFPKTPLAVLPGLG